jgi:RNA-directed DNA polymerase
MIVLSKDKCHRTTKLERIGKLAIKDKTTVFNNIGHALDLNLLHASYRKLDGKKAIGIDNVTKANYGKNLEANLIKLLKNIRNGAYKPKASKLVEISKDDGGKRPLAISCFEDKIVQVAISSILTLIFEPLFLPCSYGYREGKSAHEALRALMKYSNKNSNGGTVEIDLQKYFDSIPHKVLTELLQKKIADKRFLNLIIKLIRAPIMVDGKGQINKIGCPQGSIISPILSNIYLHYVLDEWFEAIKQEYITGRAEMIRFSDDMVFVFQYKAQAERFYRVLPKRLNKYGLQLQESKSRVMSSGGKVAEKADSIGKRLPTYKFLGFTVYWGKSRAGFWRLKYKSRSDRYTAKLKGLRKYLGENKATETSIVIKQVTRVVRGWINYHAISDNQKIVDSFNIGCKRALFWWINRKGGKRGINWVKFVKILKKYDYPERFKTISMFATC